MHRWHPQNDPHSTQPAYSSSSTRSRKRLLEPSSPNQYQREPSTRRQSIIGHNSSTHLRPFDSDVDHHSRPSLKPFKRSITITSPGWDPVGDDDALYIQSDDTHLRDIAAASQNQSSHTRSSRLDQALLQARKRKRTTSSFDRNPPSSKPSATSQSSRPLMKHDAEGCSNCRTKQSTCWYKKSKPILLSDGTEAWGEEKLCNPCSMHWNKNGYHRNVKPKAPKQIPQPRPAIIPCRSSSSRNRRSRPADLPVGLSSPTASITKVHSTLNRPQTRSGSPSQLTLAAEREARIVKRSVAKANAKSNALRQKKQTPKFGYISEEQDELYDKSVACPPIPPSHPSKHSSRKASRSLSLRNDPTTPGGRLSTRERLLSSVSLGDACSTHNNHHPTQIPFHEQQALESFSNQLLPNQLVPYSEPSQEENMHISPPRTPPPSARIPTTRNVSPPRNSPGQLCDLSNILSPSFLNGSPNSLLQRLNSQKLDISAGPSNLSAAYLSDFPPSVSEKVFSPSRFLASPNKSNPLPPVAEPIKKPSPNPLSTGSVGLLDAHLNSSSSGRSQKQFIFSPSRSAPKSKENERQLVDNTIRKSHKTKTIVAISEFPDPLPGPSKVRRHKKISGEAYRVPLPPLSFSQSISDTHLEPPRPASKSSTRKKCNYPSSGGQPKQTMARTIWCRRMETAGVSSEDSQLEGLFGRRMRGQSPLESWNSEEGYRKSTPVEHSMMMVKESGLSSGILRGLNPSLSTERARLSGSALGGYSDGQMFSASSPPVLPPPSDCSEGITPHSGEPNSDEADKELEENCGHLDRTTAERNSVLPKRAGRYNMAYDLPVESLDHSGGPLRDMTSSMNLHLRPSTNLSSQRQQPSSTSTPSSCHGFVGPSQQPDGLLDGLSPEIVAALADAMKAGLSADELAQALRAIDSPLPPPPSALPPSSTPDLPANQLVLDPALQQDFLTLSDNLLASHHTNLLPQDQHNHPDISFPFDHHSTSTINNSHFNHTINTNHNMHLNNLNDFLMPLQDLDGLFNLSSNPPSLNPPPPHQSC